MIDIKTTSAYANRSGSTLDVILNRMNIEPDTVIELAVGCKPTKNTAQILKSYDNTFVGHHTIPTYLDGLANPSTERGRQLVLESLIHFGIRYYSFHPFALEEMKPFVKELDHLDILWAIETMFPNPGYYGTTFEDMVYYAGYFTPNSSFVGIVLDTAHVRLAKYSPENIKWLFDNQLINEVHYSSNDGVHDLHNVCELPDYIPIQDNVLYVSEGRQFWNNNKGESNVF